MDNKAQKIRSEYYLGLDMGTSSIGWAVTDENYNLLRSKGKDLWGVRLFDEAKTAEERRINRISRRRRQRETARIGLLKEFFAEEIEKIDAGFYQRLDESRYHIEDRENKQPFAIFSDTGYTDKEYYNQYPTIFHLRKELLETNPVKPHDVRLVYMALLNMFKHRGHFLNTGLDSLEESQSIGVLCNDLCEKAQFIEVEDLNFSDTKLLEEILSKKDISRSKKAELIAENYNIDKKNQKRQFEIIKLICGLECKVANIFGEYNSNDESDKIKISFSNGNYESIILENERLFTETQKEFLGTAKEIHDKGIVSSIMNGCKYLSQARVESYNKHKSDLKRLQNVIKKYLPEQYNDFFRVMQKDNYSGYIGSVNSKEEKLRRVEKGGKNRDALYTRIKKMLKPIQTEDTDIEKILADIENETFMPKQLTSANGIIPNQLHLSEMMAILKNAEEYLPFLKEIDETNLTVSQRIIEIFKFQIPYYIGPLNDIHKKRNENDKKYGTAWIVRKKQGKIFPWNISEMVDMRKTREDFIVRMVRHCTYLHGETALPKNSLLYEKYKLLNELNNLKIRGEKPDVQLKKDIFNDLFISGKKVSEKRLTDYLISRGVINKNEKNIISGIDCGFSNTLSSMAKMERLFPKETGNAKNWEIMENIIFWYTVYSNDKKMVMECIEENYKGLFSPEQIKIIKGFKFSDWGQLSKEFLLLKGVNNEDGEICSLITAMWENNDNLMECLSSKYTYAEELENKVNSTYKVFSELKFEDLQDSYCSAPVKRMVWQTMLIIKDLYNVIGYEPKKIFIEMAREKGNEGKRTKSRKKKFEELYKKCKDDGIDWESKIKNTEESEFRRKKLYLYYTQKGRCMYTGEVIDFSNLYNDNLYDIDHIYPRHFVKDDSIENNLVLVKKQINAHKSDMFPIEEQIRKNRYDFWTVLQNVGFITKEKFERLIRNTEFSENELAGFIARQLVETRQGTKAVAKLLKQTMPDSMVEYPKAGNVSDFRHKFDLLKVRNINSMHHADDAYLNIVVGNVYTVKFTRNPLKFIKEYKNDKVHNKYSMSRMFDFDVVRDSETAWVTGKRNDDCISITTVKKMLNKNSKLFTRMNYEQHGGLAEQTIYKASVAKKESYIPVKSGDLKAQDVTKYGGFSSVKGAYYFLVEHGKSNKRVRTIETVPLYMKAKIEEDENELIKYCVEKLGLVNPDIRLKKIKMQSLIKRNGFFLHIAGRSETRILVKNAVPLFVEYKWSKYVRELNKFVENGIETEEISKEKNGEFYGVLLQKHVNEIYADKPNPLGAKLIENKEKFALISLRGQAEALLEILKITECSNLSMNAKELGIKSSAMKISNKVSDAEEFILINQSVTGVFENRIDLKKI